MVSALGTKAPDTSASIFFKLQTEVLTNADVEVNLFNAEKRLCWTADTNIGLLAGAQATFFGLSISGDYAVNGIVEEKVRKGDGC